MHGAVYLLPIALLASGCREPSRPPPAQLLVGPTPQSILLGTSPNEELGTTVLVADWDADGVEDLLVSALGSAPCGPRCAHVELRFGGPTGLQSAPDRVVLTGDPGMGASLAVGDFDLDGRNDLAVSSTSGQLGIWHGAGRDGFGPQLAIAELPSGVARPAWTVSARPRSDGAQLLSLGIRDRGPGESAAMALLSWSWSGQRLDAAETPVETNRTPLLGARLVPAGDLDGDGAADTLLFAPAGGPHNAPTGAAWVVPGADRGVGSPIRIPLPERNSWMFPKSGASVGDLDGDGRAELLLGSDTAEEGPDREGVVQLHRGRPPEDAGGPAWEQFGGSMDAGLGREIVAGCPSASGNPTAVVVSGRVDLDSQGRASIRMLEFDSSLGVSEIFRAEPNIALAGFGSSVAIGDTDGDGVCEVFVGAPGYRAEGRRRGAVISYVYPKPPATTEQPPPTGSP